MTTDGNLPSSELAAPERFWRTKAIIQSSLRHGIWAGFRLALLFTRQTARNVFGRHHRILIALWYVSLLCVGCALLLALRSDFQVTGSGDLWRFLLLLATALSMIFIALGKATLPKEFQQQLWFYCLSSWCFAAFLGGVIYVYFDAWIAFHTRTPSIAVLVAIGAGGVVIGFRIVFGWLVRGMLKPVQAVTDPSEFAGFTSEGRWRICIHESGHALCYGLGDGVPDDASVGVDTDSFNLVAGVVTLPQPRDITAISRSLLEWQLLMLMAGGAAERHFFGEESVCGMGDQEAFARTAAQYLLAGYGEIYTPIAKEAAEVEANRHAIRRLREHYSKVASDFIAANAEICMHLARLVDAREWLGSEDLAALDMRVSYPEGRWPLRWPESVVVHQRSR